MKKVILSIVLMLAVLTSFSQNLESGYRGFAEAGICRGSLPEANVLGPMNANRLNISTVHGYQFNPRFYLGGGLVNHIYTEGYYSISLFANVRVDFLDKSKTPFIDFRGGHSFGDYVESLDFDGGYLAFSAGFRFNHCNISAGWEGSAMEYCKGAKLSDATTCHLVANSFMIKFGFDWGGRADTSEKN